MDALSKINEFLVNSKCLVQSGAVPGNNSRDTNRENHERNKDAIVNAPPHTVISDPDAVLHSSFGET